MLVNFKNKICFITISWIVAFFSIEQKWQVDPNTPLGTFMVNQPGFSGRPIIKPDFEPIAQSKRLAITHLRQSIIVDGRLDESVWAQAASITDFIGKQSDETVIKLLYDENTIYIGGTCQESWIDKIVSRCGQRDAPVMTDDHVGIYITPIEKKGEQHFYQGYYYYIAVNPSGTVFDAFYNPWHGGMFYPNWNPDIQVKTTVTSDKWVFEIAIAFNGLEYYLPAGREYVLNFTRKQFSHGTEIYSYAKSGVVVKTTYESMVPWRIPFYDSRFVPLSEYWPDSLEFIRPKINLHKAYKTQSGVIDWAKAATIANLVMHDTGKLPRHRTTVQLTYDDDNLYIRYICYESLMDELLAKNKVRDWPGWQEWGTYRSPEKYRVEDDAVGMYISPNFDDRDQYHNPYHLIMVNVDGVLYDGCFDEFGIFYKSWDSASTSKITKQQDRWIVELTIPFSSFDVRPIHFENWGINPFRRRPSKSDSGPMRVKRWRKGKRKSEMDVEYEGGYEITCWSPTYGHLRNPIRMGVIKGINLDIVSQVRMSLLPQLNRLKNQLESLVEDSTYSAQVNSLQTELVSLQTEFVRLSLKNITKYYQHFKTLKSKVNTWHNWVFSKRLEQISPTDRRLTDVHFVDQDNGWAVGATGLILHTSNGGITWEIQNSGTDYELEGVYFTDRLNGWVVGGQIRPPRKENFLDRDVGAMGIILHTQDGGNTWLPQLMGDGRWFYDITFVDDSVGWVVGAFGVIMKTEDSGDTWQIQRSGSLKWLNEVCFTDRNHAWVACEDEEVLVTTDGGENWYKVKTPLHQNTNNWPGVLNAIYFTDNQLGWTVGRGGNIFRSDDGGKTWSRQILPYEDYIKELVEFQDVQFIDANKGWAVSCLGDVLFYTNDGGQSWHTSHLGNRNWLHALYFINANTGWVVGERGTILKTIDGGRTWQLQRSDGDQLDILVLHAHSDDELAVAYLTAYYADQGYKVGYIRYTRNDLSTYRLGELRTQEYRATSAFLGGVVNRTMYLCINGGRQGFPMPYMVQEWGGWGPSERWMVAAIRALRPKVIITQEMAFDKVSHSVGAYMVINSIKAAAEENKYPYLNTIGLVKWETLKVYFMVWPRLFKNSYNPWPATLKIDDVLTKKSPRLDKTYKYIGIHAFTYCQSQGGYKGHHATEESVPAKLHLFYSKVRSKKDGDIFDGISP